MTETMTEAEMMTATNVESLEKREKRPAKDKKNNKPRTARPVDEAPALDEPLVKPNEVLPPDETKHNLEIQKLKDKIEAGEAKINGIDAEIVVLKTVREKQNAATKEISIELKQHRDKMRAAQFERDAMQERFNQMTEKKKSAQERLKNLRKQFKTTNVVEIDAEIAQIEHRLKHETHDLKTEKEYVHKIKKLTADKDTVKEYSAEVAAAKAKDEEHEQCFQMCKAKRDACQAMRMQERDILAKLDAAKAGAVEGEEAETGDANKKIQELMNEKMQLIQDNKNYRAAQKDVSVQVKVKFAEFREYQRALAAYKDKLDKVEYQKRRAEQQERFDKMKEERKEKEKKRAEDTKKMLQRMAAVANGYQVYISGLALRADERDLETTLQSLGTISDILLVRDKETELSRGFAFVTFEEESSAKDAIKQLNRKEHPTLCPPHGRLTLKMAEKSRPQKDWEKANPNKILNKPKALKALKASSDGTTPDKTDACPPPPAPAAEEPLESSTAAHATAEGGSVDVTEEVESVDVTEEVVSSPVVSAAEETKQRATGGGHANGSEASNKIKEGGKKGGVTGGGGGTWEATREDWKIDAHAQATLAAPEA